jgi:hypothetical protein
LHGKIPAIGRLEVNDLSIGKNGSFKIFDFAAIHVSGHHLKFGQYIIEHALRPGIWFLYRNDMIAGLNIGKNGSKDGGGAAVEHQAIFCPVECGQFSAQNINGGIETTAVEIGAVFVFKNLCQVIYIFEGEIARLHYRRCDGTEVLVAVFAQLIQN